MRTSRHGRMGEQRDKTVVAHAQSNKAFQAKLQVQNCKFFLGNWRGLGLADDYIKKNKFKQELQQKKAGVKGQGIKIQRNKQRK